MDLARELGVPFAQKKTEGPVPVITFLVIELHTAHQMSRLPQNKMTKLIAFVLDFLAKRKATLLELQ